MALVSQISSDLKTALKSGDRERVGVLRMVSAALENERFSEKGELSDDKIVAVLRREVKKRVDAAEGFRKGDREEQACTEEREKAIIEQYLPSDFSDEELERIVRDAIQETGMTSVKDFGRIMGSVMSRVAGRADGTRVRIMVEKILSAA